MSSDSGTANYSDIESSGDSSINCDGVDCYEVDKGCHSDGSVCPTYSKRVKAKIKHFMSENKLLHGRIAELQAALKRQDVIFQEISAIRKPFVHPPSEILDMIFIRSFPPPFVLDPSGTSSAQSFFSLTLRHQKAVLNVCKAWYTVCMPYLYEDIYIKRTTQLQALYRTVEHQPSLGQLVKKINVCCFIPNGYSDRFGSTLKLLLQHCPRLLGFAYTSPCSPPPQFALPSLNYAITHLELNKTLPFSSMHAVLDQVCHSLISLSLFLPSVADTAIKDFIFHLPLLKSLFFNLTPASARRLTTVAQWTMPALIRITFKFTDTNAWEPGVSMHCFTAFCTIHGRSLKYLHFHPEYFSAMPKMFFHIQSVLDQCPNLEHLVLHPRTVVPLAHPSIKWIDIWDSPGQDTCTTPWQELRNGITTNAFPSLKGVRVIGAEFGILNDLPIHVPPHSLFDESDAFEYEFFGFHLRHEHGRVHFVERKWSDRSRHRDPDYVPETDSENEFSSSPESSASSSSEDGNSDNDVSPMLGVEDADGDLEVMDPNFE